MQVHGPCSDWTGVVHIAIVTLGSVTTVVVGFLARRASIAARERRALYSEIRLMLDRDGSNHSRLFRDLEGGRDK